MILRNPPASLRMNAPRFFVTDTALAVGTEAQLPPAAAHHATRVLRLAIGDPITLFDGRGGEYPARLLHIDQRGARVGIEGFSAVEREAGIAVTLAMSVIATDSMDIAVRKAVELGAARIEPVAAARSQGSARGERSSRRVEHWRQIAQAACEQCGRNRIPPVADIVALETWLEGAGAADAMLAPAATEALVQRVAASVPRAIVVGPEGGFTDPELALAQRRGVTLVHMGARVLRAETAAIAALAIVNAVAGDAR
jgi:16S rRNA (uracil1498-N3)-methyltransferase